MSSDKENNKKYYHHNGQRDTVMLTDYSGTVVKKYSYDAFGNEVGISSDDKNPFRYRGEYYDNSTGTYYLRARYYNPVTGRMLTQDTYRGDPRNPLSLNLYIYCMNNPIMYIDPSGNIPEWLSKVLGYVEGAGKQIIFGNYYKEGVSLLGTGGQIFLGFTGLDNLADIRDIWYDIENWEWTWEHAGQLGIDTIALLPVIGSLKYADEVYALAKNGIKGTGSKIKTNLGKEIDITPSPKHTTTTKNPGLKGEANSSIDILDSKGNIKTRRWYGPDGKQIRDIDFTNHGNPKLHPEWPHEHGPRQ